MNQLFIDIGHSRLKAAMQTGGELSVLIPVDYDEHSLLEKLNQIVNSETIDSVWYSCLLSSGQCQEIHDSLTHISNQVHACVTQAKQCGVTNGYKEFSHLGSDRWLAMIAAYTKYKSSFVVIDCGTAITIDCVDINGQHDGGMILPGYSMMQNGLTHQTELNYHQVQGLDFKVNNLLSNLGKTTSDGIELGVIFSVCSLIETIYTQRKEQSKSTRCIITGGDAERFAQHLNCEYQIEPNIVIDGMLIYSESI